MASMDHTTGEGNHAVRSARHGGEEGRADYLSQGHYSGYKDKSQRGYLDGLVKQNPHFGAAYKNVQDKMQAAGTKVRKGADMYLQMVDNSIEFSKARKQKGYIAPVALAAGGGATAGVGALAHRGAKVAEHLARSDNYGPEAVKGAKVLSRSAKGIVGLGAAGVVGGGALARHRMRSDEGVAKGLDEPIFYSAFRR
jgi:hypothetical protein